MDKEQQRAAFEKWLREHTTLSRQLSEDGQSDYFSHSTELAWIGWQAAIEQASQPDDAIVRYDDGTNIYLDHFAGGAHAHGEWAELGLRFESKDGEITYKQFKRTDTIEQASQPQWIPVSEQLPPEGEPVLIWMRPETVHDSIHNVIVSNPVFARKQAELGFVTHWMPLPAVPKAIP